MACHASAVMQPVVQSGLSPALLIGIGVCFLGVGAGLFLLLAIPTLWTVRKTALELQQLIRALTAELPDTAAAVRLSTLELADCLEEVQLLSNDVTRGVRASAQMITSTHASVLETTELMKQSVQSVFVPAVHRAIPPAREFLEEELRRRAGRTGKQASPSIVELARTTKQIAHRTRTVWAAVEPGTPCVPLRGCPAYPASPPCFSPPKYSNPMKLPPACKPRFWLPSLYNFVQLHACHVHRD
eukprot:jgi/Botrbrau1/19013/Bobra.0100s0045.1